MAPSGSSWAVGGARIIVLVVHGADLEGALAIVVLDAVTAAVVANGGVGPLDIAGAGFVAGLARAVRGFLGLVPVVVRTHGRAVGVCARVVLDEVAGEGVAAGGGVAAGDARDDVAAVGGVG